MSRLFTLFALFALGFFALPFTKGLASPPPPSDIELLSTLSTKSGGKLKTVYHDETGRVSFLSTANGGQPIPTKSGQLQSIVDAQASARLFMTEYGSLFGIDKALDELAMLKAEATSEGRTIVRFQQLYKGIPVMGGELNVLLTSKGEVVSVNGEASPELAINMTPKIIAEEARQSALEAIAKAYHVDTSRLTASQPQLWIYDPRLLDGPATPLPALVWRTEITSTDLALIRELVLVHAQIGSVVLNFNQIDSVKQRIIYDNANNPAAGLPGTGPVRLEGSNPSSIADVDFAYDYAGHTYDYYYSWFGRDSLDGAGMGLISTVRYCDPDLPPTYCPYANAFWNGEQMVYGQGYSISDDAVGHEMTHGVTEHESNLFYYYESGAISEALSDIFGEFIDQGNGAGNDSPEVAWLIGEDLPGGAIRSMSDPTIFGDADNMTSPNYTCDPDEFDNGGVHTNSGVANKAAYLMAVGGYFNGKTVSAIGPEKTSRIWYKAQTDYLLSSSDFGDLSLALGESCFSLVGSFGIVQADCDKASTAISAVEMHQESRCSAWSGVTVCGNDFIDETIWEDNFEEVDSSSNWEKTTLLGANQFYLPQNPNPFGFDATYATSGSINIWGYPSTARSDVAIEMKSSVTIPMDLTSYLRFNHAYGFENIGMYNFDGGIIEYNDGQGWIDAGPLLVNNKYKAGLYYGTDNPLANRNAFAGNSGGYVTSRANISSLEGKNVRFRFRIGTDTGGTDYGWFIDDFRIYACLPPPPHAGNDYYSTLEETPLSRLAPGVLWNDYSNWGDLRAVLVDQPKKGSLILLDSGSFTYTPWVDQFGQDTFRYRAYNKSYSDPATVTITITNINDPPVGVDDLYLSDPEQTLSVAAPGVMLNDLEKDGQVMTASLIEGPAMGNLIFGSDGAFDYEPPQGFQGAIQFTYSVSDGTTVSSPTLVNILIADVKRVYLPHLIR